MWFWCCLTACQLARHHSAVALMRLTLCRVDRVCTYTPTAIHCQHLALLLKTPINFMCEWFQYKSNLKTHNSSFRDSQQWKDLQAIRVGFLHLQMHRYITNYYPMVAATPTLIDVWWYAYHWNLILRESLTWSYYVVSMKTVNRIVASCQKLHTH